QVGKEVRDGFQNHTQNPKFTESSVLNLTATPSQKHLITNPKDQVAVTGSASEAPGDVILDEAVTPTGHSEYTTGDDNSENSAFTHSDSGKNFQGMVTGMNGHGNPGSGIAASGKMVSGHPIFQLSLSNPADLGAGVQRILRQYLQQTLNAQNNEVQQIFIRLHPQHLGLMRIHLKYEKDGLRGKIDVSNAETLTLLQGQLKQLTERLNLQGIEVQQFDISQQEQFASASHSFREWQGMGKKRNVFTGHDVESSGNGMSDSTPRLSDGHLNVFM
ncbi:MAG: flagellar hook-length control protein FliK, partial [Calditrichaeota bacterium]